MNSHHSWRRIIDLLGEGMTKRRFTLRGSPKSLGEWTKKTDAMTLRATPDWWDKVHELCTHFRVTRTKLLRMAVEELWQLHKKHHSTK